MSKSIPPYRLKIERAKRHIRELAAEVQTFLASQPYEIFAEDDASAGQRHYKVRVKACVPAEWSMIIGDVIHNARSALDLLMVEVVKFCDPNRVSYNHVYFVIRESKEEFEKALPEKIKGASAEARRIIEDLKPYKGGDEAFYMLHQLDVADKHKAIIPVGAAHRNVTVDIAKPMREAFPDMAGNLPPTLIALRPANRQFPLQDGATVFTTGVDGPFNDDAQITIEIAFGEGQILEGEPLDPALAQIIQFVEGVIDVFETGLPGLGR